MRAALVASKGKIPYIAIEDVPVPEIADHEVLVRVKAAGLNRGELALSLSYSQIASAQDLPVAGIEFAGEVVKLGKDVTSLKLGARVMGWATGAQAEFCKARPELLIPVPDDVDLIDAAALPIALMTMHNALLTAGHLQPGETVLIQGAASGVGIIGMQIAKWRKASTVLVAARSKPKLEKLTGMGADLGIDTGDKDWPEAVQAATQDKGVDLIIDMLSGDAANGNLKACKVGGRIINVGRLAGMTGDFDFDLHAFKRINYIGVTFRTRNAQEIDAIVSAVVADLTEEIASRRIRIPIDRTFPLEDLSTAHDYMRSNKHFGKIVITI